ncbi:unnamed protein product [Soboliphyme baturini]|uniref:Endo/exonuclease/phosphatase domain-containing protein n=1 Tax=Soboliphyme baturini TaxID=241478 RepID=A0A183ILG6_9BILA|nr:unnamed protein product [Soboliphyme baturini]
MAAQRRLKKTDGTTAKTPVSNGVASHSERRRQTARCHYSTSEKAPRERDRQWELIVRNWNISSLTRKKQELVDEALTYQFDVVGLSSTKRKYSEILSVDITTLTQADVGVLVELNLADKIVDWMPVSGRVVILRLKTQQAKTLTIVQVYARNLDGEYDTFFEEWQRHLSEVTNAESLMGDFIAHIRVDAEKCNGVIGKSGMKLLWFLASNALSIMNISFEHRRVRRYTWYRVYRLTDVGVKRGVELSTGTCVGMLRREKRSTIRRSGGRSIQRIKREILSSVGTRAKFANNIARRFAQIPVMPTDVETEWQLRKSGILEAAAECCGFKRVGLSPGSQKRPS